MSLVQRVGKNICFYIGSQIASYVLSFVFFIYAARYLGVEDFGLLSFAIALMGIFGVFGDLGLRQISTREISRNNSLAGKHLGNALMMRVILMIIVLAAVVLFMNLFGYPIRTRQVVYILSLSMIFNSFSQAFYGVFQAYEKMEFESMGNILKSFLLVVCIFFVKVNNLSVLALALLYSLTGVIVLGYTFFICVSRFLRLKLEADLNFWKATLKESFPFGLTGIFGMLYHWVDTVMLSVMKGNVVVAWYNVAYRIFVVLLLISSAFDVAIFPAMSRLHITSKDSLNLVCEKCFKYLTLIGIPIGIGGTLLADRIILLTFGNQYRPSIIAFQILVWAAVLIFMSTPFASLLNSVNKQAILAKIVGASVAFNIFLNLLLIPKYSYIGAAFVTLMSEILLITGIFFAILRTGSKISVQGIINFFLKALVSGMLMGIFIIYFKGINLFLLIVISFAIYAGSLFLIKVFDSGDLVLFNKLILKR
jgi:O-antigen/teichoic acid export membrane protein